MQHDNTYPPLDTLKPVATDLWIVDSRHHAMGIPLPVRMSVVRLGNGEVWLHSPTRYDDRLRSEIEEIGPIRHLVAPNVVHWSFLKDWQSRCAGALTWAAPGLRNRWQVRLSGVSLDHDLHDASPQAWAGEIDQTIVPGGLGVNEVAFFHRPSRTVLLTDLIQNFEPEKLPVFVRPLVQFAGAMAPDGQTPAHLRLAINVNRTAAAQAAQRVIGWAPERVVFAHGRWFEADGTAQLRRAFRWLVG